LDDIENRTKSFSLVEFSTNAEVKRSLVTARNVRRYLNNDIDYMGGYTNTAEAIKKCQYSFRHSPPDEDRQNVILLVTDGVPTRPRDDPVQAAKDEADVVKGLSNPTYVQPVFINAGGNPPSAVSFMNNISSGGVFTIDDFDDLDQDAVARLKAILC